MIVEVQHSYNLQINGEWRNFGVTSRGSECGKDSIYGLMHHNICWIEDETGINLTGELDYCSLDDTPIIEDTETLLERCLDPFSKKEEESFAAIKQNFNLNSCDDLAERIEKRIDTNYEVTLDDQFLRNLSSLSLLVGYGSIDLSANGISDGDIFRQKDRRESLTTSFILDMNKFENLDFLKDFPTVEYLRASFNNLGDVSTLEDLQNLTYINLSDNRIEQIPTVAPNTLSTLEIANNRIKNIESLSSQTNLRRLITGNNPIIDFSPISSLKKLNALNVNDSQFSDLDILSGFQNLGELNLRNSKLKEFHPEFSTNNIRQLDISNNEISGILDLSNYVSLYDVELNNNRLEAVYFPAELSNSQNPYLNLSNNKISEIRDLPTNITDLHLANNKLADLDFLNKNHSKIEFIDLTGNNDLKDLSRLFRLPALELIYLPYIDDYITYDQADIKNLRSNGVKVLLYKSQNMNQTKLELKNLISDIGTGVFTKKELSFLIGLTKVSGALLQGNTVSEKKILTDMISAIADCESSESCTLKNSEEIENLSFNFLVSENL